MANNGYSRFEELTARTIVGFDDRGASAPRYANQTTLIEVEPTRAVLFDRRWRSRGA